MKTKQWMQIATLASALAISGATVANGARNEMSDQEQAGAAVNANTPARPDSDVKSNSATQPGTDTPKGTVPSDSDATTPRTAVDTSRQSAEHPPTNRMDQATPTEKTPSDKPVAKHPPTARMDAATPDEKSPKTSQ